MEFSCGNGLEGIEIVSGGSAKIDIVSKNSQNLSKRGLTQSTFVISTKLSLSPRIFHGLNGPV